MPKDVSKTESLITDFKDLHLANDIWALPLKDTSLNQTEFTWESRQVGKDSSIPKFLGGTH